jgi:ubiquitin-like modifier-activating enzyme ATG7
MLCAAYGKMCINTALGFDNYVVMRHGSNYPEFGSDTKDASAPSTPAPVPAAAATSSSSSSTSTSESKGEAGPTSPSSSYGTPYDPIHTRLGCYFCNDVVAPSDVSSHQWQEPPN